MLRHVVQSVLDDCFDTPNTCGEVLTNPCGEVLTNPCSEVLTNPCGEVLTNPCGEVLTNPCGEVLTNPCGEVLTNPCGEVLTNPCSEVLTNPCGEVLTNPCGKYLSASASIIHNSLYDDNCILNGCSATMRFCIRIPEQLIEKIQTVQLKNLLEKCFVVGNDNKHYIQNNENAYAYWSQLLKYSHSAQRNYMWCPHELILTFDPDSFKIVSEWGKYDSCVLNISSDKLAKCTHTMYFTNGVVKLCRHCHIIKKTFQYKVMFDLPKVNCDDKILDIVSSCTNNTEKHEKNALIYYNSVYGNNFAINNYGELVNFKDKIITTLLPSSSSDGTSSDGTSSGGTSSDGTSSGGTSSDGTSSDGTSSDGTSYLLGMSRIF
jgi:hypothetical protein